MLLTLTSRPHHPDNRPDWSELVVAIEVRRVERRHRAVEEERVPTAKAVAEEAREGVEGHRLVGDGEHDRAAFARAHPVADLLRGSARPDLRVNPTLDDQHRSRLGRIARGRR